jgi:hypothetical protein
VYVVGVMVRLVDIELWVVLGDFKQFLVEALPEYICDTRVTVFSGKDEMIVA